MTKVARPEEFAQRLDKSNVHHLKDPSTAYCSDRNWGCARNPKTKQMQFVNFKTVTVRSLVHITMLASLNGESFRINPWETVRDYMNRLRKQCPEIDAKRIDEFILLYEEARFADRNFEADKWEKLSENVLYFDEFQNGRAADMDIS